MISMLSQSLLLAVFLLVKGSDACGDQHDAIDSGSASNGGQGEHNHDVVGRSLRPRQNHAGPPPPSTLLDPAEDYDAFMEFRSGFGSGSGISSEPRTTGLGGGVGRKHEGRTPNGGVGGGAATAEGEAITRCSTRHPTQEEMQRVEKELSEEGRRMEEIKTGAGINGRARRLQEVIDIDVYFHVITDSAGDGAVTDQQIAQQMTVLNDSFRGVNSLFPSGCTAGELREQGNATPFRFSLAQTNRVQNDEYFTTGLFEEGPMRDALHLGGSCLALNIYSKEFSNAYYGDTFQRE
jgi:hypothetical protein